MPRSLIATAFAVFAVQLAGGMLLPSLANAQSEQTTAPVDDPELIETERVQGDHVLVRRADTGSPMRIAYPRLFARDEDRFKRRIYVGFGVGRSWLEPDTSEIPGVDPNDRVQRGMQLTIGSDINKWFSLEGHLADLGDAGLSGGAGEVAYSQFGASALFYVGKNRHRFNRRGLSGYGRLGLGSLATEGNGPFDVVKDNAIHFLAGVGAEYSTRSGVALRAEGITFDTDVNYLQIGALYRFGKRSQSNRELYVDWISSEVIVVEAPEPEIEEPVIAAAQIADSDDDGVSDTTDDCPDTTSFAAVDERGCALLSGVIEGVNFATSSARLTAGSKLILDEVAATLKRFPSMNYRLSAHTDSQGAEAANLSLSQRRADSVATYLTSAGIARDRFAVQAWGETRPIADNSTAAGRATNRRVELVAVR